MSEQQPKLCTTCNDGKILKIAFAGFSANFPIGWAKRLRPLGSFFMKRRPLVWRSGSSCESLTRTTKRVVLSLLLIFGVCSCATSVTPRKGLSGDQSGSHVDGTQASSVLLVAESLLLTEYARYGGDFFQSFAVYQRCSWAQMPAHRELAQNNALVALVYTIMLVDVNEERRKRAFGVLQDVYGIFQDRIFDDEMTIVFYESARVWLGETFPDELQRALAVLDEERDSIDDHPLGFGLMVDDGRIPVGVLGLRWTESKGICQAFREDIYVRVAVLQLTQMRVKNRRLNAQSFIGAAMKKSFSSPSREWRYFDMLDAVLFGLRDPESDD
ncbi:MAG: hypothetical protein KDB07_02185 [Planctomycetes bacterium]|nr:hypothetical protein [Planctomycetota bacterium]